MSDTVFIGADLLSNKILFYVFVVFFIAVGICTFALVYHWVKYAKELDFRYKLMPVVYLIGILFLVMVSFGFYLML